MEPPCPFCEPDRQRIFYEGELVLGLWDAFPVSPGHALLVPRRHIEDWWGATHQEHQALLAALAIARQAILKSFKPDGFNIGWNVGAAAGQTGHEDGAVGQHGEVRLAPEEVRLLGLRPGLAAVPGAEQEVLLEHLAASLHVLVEGGEK